MNVGFSELIREIDSALRPTFQGGAYQWIDETMDGAWSKAADEFERGVIQALEKKDFGTARELTQAYKHKVLGQFAAYRTHKNLEEAGEFIASLGLL